MKSAGNDMDLEERRTVEPEVKKVRRDSGEVKKVVELDGQSARGREHEVEIIKSELQTKDNQISILQKTLQGMQTQLLEAQMRSGILPDFLQQSAPSERIGENISSRKSEQLSKSQCNLVVDLALAQDVSKGNGISPENVKCGNPINTPNSLVAQEEAVAQASITPTEAKSFALISTFLSIHPAGASVDCIQEYLSR